MRPPGIRRRGKQTATAATRTPTSPARTWPNTTAQSRAPPRPADRRRGRATSRWKRWHTKTRFQVGFACGASSAPGGPRLQDQTGIETGQATGVTGRSQATFGPATRDDYDSSQWALVHTADLPRATTSESIPDIVSPSHCKRDDGPAILKPLPNADYLPALLVLLHGVPLARNIFMSPEVVADDYGDNADWWKGEVTNFRGTVSSGSVEDHSESERQFLYEVQRLMAFLDGTDRAYGSIEPLIYQGALLKHIGAGTPCGNELFRFLATWAAVAQRQTGVELDGVLRCIVEVNGVEEAPEWCLDASISTKHAQMGLTLYDVLDEHFFTGSNMAFLAKPSKVLLLKLSVTDDRQEPVNIKVPATLYADRYLAKNKDAVLSEYRDVRHHRDRLQEINHLTEKYRYSTRGEGDRYDGLALLRMTMQLYQPSESDSREAEKNARVVAQLQSVYDRVERKLKGRSALRCVCRS